ncbi:MAG: DUF438 domain-containing protein [bacterium]
MNKRELLKSFIKKLHQGKKPEELKDEFQEAFADLNSSEIAAAEEELIKEGMPVEEVHSLCDVHIAAFKDNLAKSGGIAPPGHPIHTLMEEHNRLTEYAGKLVETAEKIKVAAKYDAVSEELNFLDHIISHFKDAAKHYLREENIVFFYLDKHGVTQPPKIMWMEHDIIRDTEKKIFALAEKRGELAFADFAQQLLQNARALRETMVSHFFKENNILFPTALETFTPAEWEETVKQFDQIGYCCFSPKSVKPAEEKPEEKAAAVEGEIAFETGSLAPHVLEALLNALPVEITFVDHNDRLKYFSQSKEMVFTRTTAALGVTVQNCHPQKSVHLVNKILADFKSGKRDIAEFWIDFQGKKVYIRYYPVRDQNGKYLGCLEVTQNIAELQKISGQRRLLDEE